MSAQQLALPAPWGYADGYSVSLFASEGVEPAAAKEAVMRFGCPAPIADKAISCLQHSGRYDCVLNPQLVESDFLRVRNTLADAGITIKITRDPKAREPGRYERKERQRREIKYADSRYQSVIDEDTSYRRARGMPIGQAPGLVNFSAILEQLLRR